LASASASDEADELTCSASTGPSLITVTEAEDPQRPINTTAEFSYDSDLNAYEELLLDGLGDDDEDEDDDEEDSDSPPPSPLSSTPPQALRHQRIKGYQIYSDEELCSSSGKDEFEDTKKPYSSLTQAGVDLDHDDIPLPIPRQYPPLKPSN
jgi:hypothetical protein